MAGAPLKNELLYISLPVDFHKDPKFIQAEELLIDQGASVLERILIVPTAFRLTNHIFKTGYYSHWREDLPFIIGEGLVAYGVSSRCISMIIHALIEVDFISKKLFEDHSILTSAQIQKSWTLAMKQKKRKNRVDPSINIFEAITSEVIANSSEVIPLISPEIQFKSAKSAPKLTPVTSITSEVIANTSEVIGNSTETSGGIKESFHNSSSSIYPTTTTTTTKKEILKNSGSGEERGAPQAKNPPGSARPPLIYNGRYDIEPEPGNYQPADLLEFYFDLPRLSETRAQVAHLLGDPNKLRAWAEVFTYQFLIGIRGNKVKTLDDYISHFPNWVKTIDTVNQNPEDFKTPTSLKNIKYKNSNSNEGSNTTTTQSTTGQSATGTGQARKPFNPGKA